jgi:chromosome segregation ATPase
MAVFTNLKVLWISVIILILLNLTTLGALWTTRTHKPLSKPVNRETRKRAYLKEHLKLNDEQIAKFSEIKIRQKEELEKKFSEIRVLREQMMTMMQEGDFSDSAQVIAHKIGDVQSEIERLNYEHFRNLLNICDNGQKKTFIETMKKAFIPGRERGYRQKP